jgi:hypothetical protein
MQPRPIFLLTHLGLGDLIMSIPMIRVLLQHAPSVKVVVKEQYYKLLSELFHTEPRLEYFVLSTDAELSPAYGGDPRIIATLSATYDMILCGSHRLPYSPSIHNYSIFPFNFYLDVGISPTVFWAHAGVAESPESEALYVSLTAPQRPYCIVHATYSGGNLFTVGDVERRFNINRNTTLILDFSKNHYDHTHPYYELAQSCIMKPLSHYITLFNRAPLIVLSDSSLFCLATQLPLTTDECYVVPRGDITFTHMYEPQFGYNPEIHPQRRFKTLRFNI